MPNMNIPKFKEASDDLFVYAQAGGVAQTGATTMAQIQEFMRNNSDVLKCLVQALWQPQVQYAVNQVVWSPNMGPNLWAKVKTAGTTLGTEPVWSELVGAEVNDGTVVYTMCEIVPTLPVTVGSINVNDDYLMTIIYTDEDQETVQLVKTINGITPTSGDVDINRKFYNSLAQLGLNYDTVTFDQIANTLPVNSTLTFYVDIVTSQPTYAPNLDIPVSGFIVVTKGDSNSVPIKFTLSPIVNNATTYLGEYTTYNSYGFKGWQPVVLSVNGAKPNNTGNVTMAVDAYTEWKWTDGSVVIDGFTVKFPNGYKQCVWYLYFPSGYSALTINFPKAFSAPPCVFGSIVVGNDTFHLTANVYDVTTTSCRCVTNNAGNTASYWVAMGYDS